MSNEIDDEISNMLSTNISKIKKEIERKYGVKLSIDVSWSFIKEDTKNIKKDWKYSNTNKKSSAM